MMPVLRGRPAAVRALARFLDMIPDLEITIHDSMTRDELVFISFGFAGTTKTRHSCYSPFAVAEAKLWVIDEHSKELT